MSNTSRTKIVREEMINIYGPNCWMMYRLDNKNRFTYHHIYEQRNGGKVTIENGALLTSYAHRDLHQLEIHAKILYRALNSLFQELNDTSNPPTIEYYKEVHDILIEANKHIELSNFCELNIDFGLLKDMIDKANETKRNHLELLDEYYKNIVTEPTYEVVSGYERVGGVYIPCSYERVLPKDKQHIILTDREKEATIPSKFKSKVKHKNRNSRNYRFD